MSHEDDGACRVRLMCMEEDEDDDDEDDEMGEDEEVSARDPDAREKLETLDERAPAGAWGARSLLAVLKTKDESAEDAKKKTQTVVKAKQTPRTCEVCDVQCFGERAWEEHVKGKAHAKKSRRDDPAAAKNSPRVAAGVWNDVRRRDGRRERSIRRTNHHQRTQRIDENLALDAEAVSRSSLSHG